MLATRRCCVSRFLGTPKHTTRITTRQSVQKVPTTSTETMLVLLLCSCLFAYLLACLFVSLMCMLVGDEQTYRSITNYRQRQEQCANTHTHTMTMNDGRRMTFEKTPPLFDKIILMVVPWVGRMNVVMMC